MNFDNETLHVVDYYNSSLKNKNEKIVNDFFNNDILRNSKINIGANKETADEIYSLNTKIDKYTKSANLTRVGMILMRVFGGIMFGVGILIMVFTILSHSAPGYMWAIIVILILAGATLFGCSWLVKNKYKAKEKVVQDLTKERDKQLQIAFSQLADFVSHFRNSMALDLFEKTYPLIKFNDYFSELDYANWTSWLQNDVNSSVLYCLSGTLNTNPFLIAKTSKTRMYDHVYTGSITVMVPVTVYQNGRSVTRMEARIVTASTTNPAPMYWNETKLFYKSNAAETLEFHNIGEFKNEKKAEKFFTKNKKMQPMENQEFDRFFPCDRNDELQFRTLFSPLAQEEMVKLMKYRNDYSFVKGKDLNIISSDQFNTINLNNQVERYTTMFDYEVIKDDFIEFNKTFFTNVYFMFAPILTIPLYQQYRFKTLPFQKEKQRLISFYQNEAVVNSYYHQSMFAHENSKTNNMLKTRRVFANTLYEINEVIAYGYNTRNRVVLVPTMGPRGMVNVPVTVIDYLPVQKSSYVTTSPIERNRSDFDISQTDDNQAPWNKYFKSLFGIQFTKHWNIASMYLNNNKKVDPDKYKEFLDQLSKPV